jgi:iron complex transport system substrate-binding protein
MRVSIFLFSCVAFLCATLSDAREVVDATGARVQVVDQPKRVITLMPSLGELVADLVGTDFGKIVGVIEYTNFPPALEKVKKVGSFNKLNLELIAGLKPDLILAGLDGNPKDQVAHLRELGLPVVIVATHSFEKIEESMKITGKALGLPEEGERIASQFRRGLRRIVERNQAQQSKTRRRVLLQVGSEPLVVVGRNSFLHEALQAIGAENIYSDLEAYPHPSLEDAVARNPDMIIILSDSPSTGTDDPSIRKTVSEWTRFPSMKAVKTKRIHVIHDESLARPTLRLLAGLDRLAKLVYKGDL